MGEMGEMLERGEEGVCTTELLRQENREQRSVGIYHTGSWADLLLLTECASIVMHAMLWNYRSHVPVMCATPAISNATSNASAEIARARTL